MVLKKRLDYGFDGYRVPVIPRAPRSLRRRALHKNSEEDSQICAIELLAAVAGKLLQDSESSSSSNVAEGKEQIGLHKDAIKQEEVEGKAEKSDCLDQGSCVESESLPELAALQRNLKSTLKELPDSERESVLGHTTIVTSSGLSKEVDSDVKLETCKSKNAVRNSLSKQEGGSSGGVEGYDSITKDGVKRQLEAVGKHTGDLSKVNDHGSKDLMGLRVNSHVLINSDSSVQMPLYQGPVPNAYFPRHKNNVNIVTRDDDENSFRCNQPNTKRKSIRPQSSMRYRRIRKMLSSRYWKSAAPKFRDYKLSNTGREVKPFYRNRKRFYARERCQFETPYKRRKIFEHRSTVAYDQEGSSGSISNSPEKGGKGDKSRSAANTQRASGVTSPGIHHKSPFQSKDHHVNFSIKSFGVPDLYIEVPETVTVGSLKRTVMEAVTAILGGELHVGLILQGKKIRDDNRTLLQSGISHSINLDNLGFTLEPTSIAAQASSPMSRKDSPFLQSCDSQKQLPRSPASPTLDSGFSNTSLDPPLATKLESHVESDRKIVPSSTDVTTEETTPDSKALIAIPPMNVDPLAVVPMNQKSKRSELSQRRTRRPFSVSEVEALVEAVEKLGTGRWRDVKMRAFDDANHRTYVDLKDKWKTLVHTASIAPQQRRGQPVPQELLDRVLAAHSHWSQHQSKQHGKHLIEPHKFGGEIIGV
ncbi:hypothetical protein LguiA_034948 [Lonicera macranthoides]